MAIGRVNAPVGDYFVGDTIKPEHIKIELDGNLDMARQNHNEYTTKREYSEKLIVSKDNNIYLFFTSGYATFCYKFDKNLKVVWRKSIEGSTGPYNLNVYYNYHKDILYIVDEEKIIVTDMDVNVITEIQHDDIFTWDDKGNIYLLSQNDKILTVQKLNNSFNKEWSEDYLYDSILWMDRIFYFYDGYIYIPNKKINVSNKKMEDSFDFSGGITNDKQNVMCLTINYNKSKVISSDTIYEFKVSTPISNTYVSDKGEVMWLKNSVLFKVVEPGILINVESLARNDREIYNVAGNNDIAYVAGAENFSSSVVEDYGFISAYKTSEVDNITITGRD